MPDLGVIAFAQPQEEGLRQLAAVRSIGPRFSMATVARPHSRVTSGRAAARRSRDSRERVEMSRQARRSGEGGGASLQERSA